jgi:molecular chaperone IbpA
MTTTLNLSPLFRTAIGFDRMVRLMDTASASTELSYPPYNIVKNADDSYTLTMAVAGFGPDDIDLTVKENTLVVSGRSEAEANQGEVLYRGIAGRAFERKFTLADHIVVEGADLRNGLLHVALKRVVPEALKARRIPVAGGNQQITAQVANDPAESAQAA